MPVTIVEKLGIADKLEAIADGYSVKNSQPAPDLLLYVASQLELESSQCVVVEDPIQSPELKLLLMGECVPLDSVQLKELALLM